MNEIEIEQAIAPCRLQRIEECMTRWADIYHSQLAKSGRKKPLARQKIIEIQNAIQAGMTHEETAALVGVSTSSVKNYKNYDLAAQSAGGEG